jgi:uncharacterized NAD-dependent epimerase/dehydratase family protein
MNAARAVRPAVILAPGYLATVNGKTSHGLIRGGDRYRVVAVIDASCAGRDAGEVAIGRPLGIPVVAGLGEALALGDVEVAVVGVATHGGVLEPAIRQLVLEAVCAGLSAVSGLHQLLADDPDIAEAARQRGVEIIDLRAPRPRSALRFWSGDIAGVRAARVAVLGTDCAAGKRTTAWLLVEALRRAGLTAEMVYTGQTGWLQGARFGFVLDATLNDYVSGELERAVLSCDREVGPDIIVIEGQSALRNPSGPCGSELILSARADRVVLQHPLARRYFEGYEDLGLELPTLADEVALIRAYGAEVIAIALNPGTLPPEEAEAQRAAVEETVGIAAVLMPAGSDALAAVVAEACP